MPRDETSLHPHAGAQRRTTAAGRRTAAATLAQARPALATQTNGEKDGPGALDWRVTSFHKGVPHDALGRPDMTAFASFLDALKAPAYATPAYERFDVPLGPKDEHGAWDGPAREPNFAATGFSTLVLREKPDGTTQECPPAVRNWESPLAGHQFDLEGPDAGDVPLAPAPRLGSDELCAEMAELYAMAALRDVSFEQMRDAGHPVDPSVTMGALLGELAALPWFDPTFPVVGATPHEGRRRNARRTEPPHPEATGGPPLDVTQLFRGAAPGVKDGPYVSQFLLIGNGARGAASVEAKDNRPSTRMIPPQGAAKLEVTSADGYIEFGAQRIDQRVNAHRPGRDYMTSWPLWLDVQNGADARGQDVYYEDRCPRFIGTPRDLATYVHFDELYQAYFSACLLMFRNQVPFDFGFPSGAAHATRGSFATWGGPHILTLLTEVTGLALKAVRRQKFQHHLRGRPEQLAAMLTLAASEQAKELGASQAPLAAMLKTLQQRTPETLRAINRLNNRQNEARERDPAIHPRTDPDRLPDGMPSWSAPLARNYLLPMAFPEGSPMHAAYGAGHATVAGACVSVLKAFFEMSKQRIQAFDPDTGDAVSGIERPLDLQAIEDDPDPWFDPAGLDCLKGLDAVYVADDETDRTTLKATDLAPSALTIEGELNKLAANVSIGRNMAGVHFYTDYYDSVRLGERMAVGMLHEKALTFCDPLTMRLTTFDGDHLVISGDGAGHAEVRVRVGGAGAFADAYDEWWGRHRGV